MGAQLFTRVGLYHNMNVKLLLPLVAVVLCGLELAPTAQAQSPNQSRRHFARRGAVWSHLSDDERTKLRAAHQKAMEDPQVRAVQDKMRQTRREFRQVMRPALLKADPSVQPILEKIRTQRPDPD